jgi:mRNA-degrading endonuclease RelE of RelBE toxin-antitoxin system
VPKGSRPEGVARASQSWIVEFATSAAREIRGYGLDDTRFRPTLRELVESLKRNPLQFPTKRGKLKNARAANVRFGSNSWRLVFVVSIAERRVRVLSVGPHDAAYARAQRRI